MRLFQLITFGRAYLDHFDRVVLRPNDMTYAQRMATLLGDRYGNSHLLQPVLDGAESARLVVADARALQNAWAREHGLPAATSAEDIVLAQIEEHRADLLYNIAPLIYDSRFLRRLPGSVKHTVFWRAAPLGSADLSGYDLGVSNFRSFIDEWNRLGHRAAWFDPAHDPVADAYVRGADRDVDVAFVGSYTWLHGRRNLLLQRIAALAPGLSVRFHLSMGRSSRLVNALGPLRRLFPKLALPTAMRRVARGPIYGRDMYELFGRARIVLNAAIDMASEFRGNMRCWEAMGCGAVMVSDEGVYPPGMKPGVDFETYRDGDAAIATIGRVLADYDAWRGMRESALATMRTTYSKAAQWTHFVRLAEQL